MKNKIIFVSILSAVFLFGYAARYTEHYSKDTQGNLKTVYKGLQLVWGDIDARVVPKDADPELVYERTETYFFGSFEESTTGGKDHISWDQAETILNEALDDSSSLKPELTE